MMNQFQSLLLLSLDLSKCVNYSAIFMIISAACTYLLTMNVISAPYGRYTASKGFGPLIPAQLAWMIMESPNLVAAIALVVYNPDFLERRADTILLSLFVLHYVNRALIYPFRVANATPMPLSVMLAALCYCTWNGLMQCGSLIITSPHTDAWLDDMRFLVGTILFAVGMAINMHSDTILLNLRKPGERTYKIPYGGMFDYVSCPNFGGEILEWFGFAIACWSLPAFAFALFTLCNIGPRGHKHHQWYQEKFKDSYPRDRFAVIPFVW